MKKRYLALATVAALGVATSVWYFTLDQRLSAHQVVNAPLGQPSSLAQLEQSLQQAGTVEFQTHISADWAVPLSGLVNLKHPTAVAAGLADAPEAIHIYVHEFTHPRYGRFFIDTGLSQQLLNAPESFGVHGMMQKAMAWDKMQLLASTQDLVAQGQPLAGVFLTHMHLDHVSGMPDIAADVPVYSGLHDASTKNFFNALTQPVINRLMQNSPPVQEWNFRDTTVLDVFADGSVFAIYAPGHTEGSTAYVVNAKQGSYLLVGDVSHTAWGWLNTVEPGDYTNDQQRNRQALQLLKGLSERHPQMQVLLGHQSL